LPVPDVYIALSGAIVMRYFGYIFMFSAL